MFAFSGGLAVIGRMDLSAKYCLNSRFVNSAKNKIGLMRKLRRQNVKLGQAISIPVPQSVMSLHGAVPASDTMSLKASCTIGPSLFFSAWQYM